MDEKNKPVENVANDIKSMYWLNSQLEKTENRMRNPEQSTEKLFQNTAQGAKEIQNMHVSPRPQVTHRGPNIRLKEFQRKRTQEMMEKQFLKRKHGFSSSGGRPEP